MRAAKWHAAIAAAGIAVAILLPLSPALSSGDVRQARLLGAVLVAAVCAALGLARGGRAVMWTTTAVVSSAAGLVLLLAHVDANATCLATYNGHAVLIGRDYTASAADYVNKHPGLSAPDLLLDAGGIVERIWTPASISSCRFWLAWGGELALPLLVAAVCALVVRRGFRYAPPAPARVVGPPPPGKTAVYDAFLSYRHIEPDKTHATNILDSLESRGLRVAIDFRDFAPNQHFLSEMERCIKESRFVLCVLTTQYLDSDNTSEEAIISKTLDMADRRKRLVPLIFDRVELPVWLHGLVGIDFSESASVDPFERLIGLLKTAPAEARR
jgi:TIR domain